MLFVLIADLSVELLLCRFLRNDRVVHDRWLIGFDEGVGAAVLPTVAELLGLDVGRFLLAQIPFPVFLAIIALRATRLLIAIGRLPPLLIVPFASAIVFSVRFLVLIALLAPNSDRRP